MIVTIMMNFLKNYWTQILGVLVIGAGYLYFTWTINSLERDIRELTFENEVQRETIEAYEQEVEFYEYNQTILEELYEKIDGIDNKYEKEIINNKTVIEKYVEVTKDDNSTDEEKKEATKKVIDLFNNKFDRMK